MAGCDRQSAETAQQQEGASEQAHAEQLTGTLDRAHAGTPIPAVDVTDPSGLTLSLGETAGKPVLLNLWATWCAPCVIEMPLLDDLAAEMDGIRVLTVSEDMQGADVVVPFFEEGGFDNLPRWLDPENELAFSFGGGAALPLTVLYDAEGHEVWRVVGGYDWAGDTARAQVAEALGAAGSDAGAVTEES